MSAWQRMIAVFMDPKATFSSFEGSISLKDVAVPLLILLTISIASQPIVMPIAIQEQMDRIEGNENIPIEQKEAALDRMESMMSGTLSMTSVVRTVAITLGWFAILAGVVMFFGSFILAGQATFQQALAIVVFVNMIGVLETAVKLPLILQSGTIQVETGMALLLPFSWDGTLLYRFFHRLDIFAIWKVALIAMGTAVVFQTSEKSARLAFFGAWVVLMFLLAWLLDSRLMA